MGTQEALVPWRNQSPPRDGWEHGCIDAVLHSSARNPPDSWHESVRTQAAIALLRDALRLATVNHSPIKLFHVPPSHLQTFPPSNRPLTANNRPFGPTAVLHAPEVRSPPLSPDQKSPTTEWRYRYTSGAATTIESKRSRTPPWPGRSALESSAPVSRLSWLSMRSPT